ncbi:MAG TPA: MATE family efflux transporter [Sphingomonadaceae bacterium]|nr:MATE family efflux transporter [Sphingomonadaceae bacterium]
MLPRTASPASTKRPWRQEFRATLLLAYPLILTNLTQAGIQATDVVMLGWAGPRQLAAGALGANLFSIFLVFGMGLMTAASPMIAQELGARFNSVRDVRRTVRQALWSAGLLAIPAWLALWNSEIIFRALGQDPGLSAAAAEYVRALQWGLLPALWFYALRGFVSALERPIWSLVVAGGGILVNGTLTYALIFGRFGLPQLGLTGAGVASDITNLLMFAAMALVVTRHRRFRRFHLFGNFWRPDRARFTRLWRLGLPIAAIFALEFGVFSAAVFLMGLIDLASVAAHAIAIQIAALTFMVPLGLSQAVTVRVGLALGRGDKAGITRAGWTCFVLGVGFMAAMALVLVTQPLPLIHAFMDESDPANAPVIPLAVTFLGVAALFQIVDGAQAVGAGMLRGLGDTAVPMVYAIFGYWVVAIGVGVALAFGAGWGGVGIWVGLASGLAVVSALMIARWMRRERLGLVGAL